ncbi:uncharacterized protein LOC127009320 isoform X2 [Eriocheir sinensis]|uniref:uncharacterized protein LOC127009320 isoform X2 n=1 Tax=Eriocheir sinensis TaxID=95602 RepID=UPI0021C610B5|nr:uncharacterized protein LOC127009320 isoform X2 [Eriocheir sinensis]
MGLVFQGVSAGQHGAKTVMSVGTRRSVLLALVLGGVLLGLAAGDYVPLSILCDDVEAICSQYGYGDNITECESDERKFLNPEICNCGIMCIKNLKEGDSCYTSSLTNYPSKMCGPGLVCMQTPSSPNSAMCVRNDAKQCLNETLLYEEEQVLGTLGPGRNKPSCDEYGFYSSRQCSPSSTCYCVNKEGKRLYGEGLFTQDAEMNCKCSRYWEETLNKGLNIGMRCLPNGNFDSLQCLGEICICYNDTTDAVTYGPVSILMIDFMPCYNSKIHTLSYINPCHRAQEVWDNQGSGIIVAEASRPVCSPDGYFAPVQYLRGMAYCADKNGNRIEDYELPIHEAGSMTCNCPRRRQLMEENGYGASKPRCCSDGEYFPWQTRGPHSYCVDENGNQYGTTVTITNMHDLECYSDQPCQTST